MTRIFILIIAALLLTGCAAKKKFESAKSTNTIDVWDNFITKYPHNKYTNLAKKNLIDLKDDTSWKEARKKNTIAGYKLYISEFPMGKYTINAEDIIKELQEIQDWDYTKSTNTIRTFEDFINKYPISQHFYEANDNLKKLKDERDWTSALQLNTVTTYTDYLTRYPDGNHTNDAKVKINEIEVILPAWEKAKMVNTIEAYRAFLEKHPASSYSGQAQEKIDIFDDNNWNDVIKKNTIQSYQEYITKYPDGKHISEAEKKLIDTEVDQIFKGEHGKLPGMIRTSDSTLFTPTNSIEIYNNTAYELTVRYSGPDSKKIVLDSRQTTYFTLHNGKYRIAASVNAVNVQNYAGTTILKGGDYSSEYYIYTVYY